MLFDNRKTQVIEVEVTKADVRRGLAEVPRGEIDPGQCAIAQALMRQRGDRWSVGPGTATNLVTWDRYSHNGAKVAMCFDMLPSWLQRWFPVTGVLRLELQ